MELLIFQKLVLVFLLKVRHELVLVVLGSGRPVFDIWLKFHLREVGSVQSYVLILQDLSDTWPFCGVLSEKELDE